MNHAIHILEQEKHLLENCLKGDWEGYSEAKKERDKRLRDVNKAIEILKQG